MSKMKNSKLIINLQSKNSNTWNQSGSAKKKVMTNNNLVNDLIFQPANEEILSIDTLMRYVQGLIPSSERAFIESEFFKEGNEFYIDALNGLVKLLDEEDGDANATLNDLARDVEETYPLFLIKRKEKFKRKPHVAEDLLIKSKEANRFAEKETIDKPKERFLEEQSRLSVEQ